MAKGEGESIFARYIRATDAARASYKKSLRQEEENALFAEKARYTAHPKNALEEDRRGWIIGEVSSGAATIVGVGGTIFLANADSANGTLGLLTLTSIAAAGTIYAEIGRWRTSRKIKKLQ